MDLASLLTLSLAVAVPPAADDGFMAQRAKKGPSLLKKGPSPQPYEATPPPKGVARVEYKSPVGKLFAWYAAPAHASGKKKVPAVVYAHGGNAFGAEDFEVARPFLDGGAALMTPTWRGENGNPGHYEEHWGELDDLVAAIRWVAQRPEVDGDRIYVFGHSAGGILSALVTLIDAPVRSTGSAGGLYDTSVFMPAETIFAFEDEDAKRLRVLPPHVGQMKHPHFAYVGRDDPVVAAGAAAALDRGSAQPLLKIYMVPGDHGAMLAPAVRAYAKRIGLKVSRPIEPEAATVASLTSASKIDRAALVRDLASLVEAYCSVDACMGGAIKTCSDRAERQLAACAKRLPNRIPFAQFEQAANGAFMCMFSSLQGPQAKLDSCVTKVFGE